MSLLGEQQQAAQSMQSISDTGALEQLGIVTPGTKPAENPYLAQPSLKMESSNNSVVLQRLNEIESLIKGGFDQITKKLSNTVVSAGHRGGARRRTKRARSKKYRR